MKRLTTILCLVVIATILLPTTVVLAFLYRSPISISENASVSHDMVAVLWNSANTWMAANGFMNSTANDTRVQTLGGLDKPWLVCDNKTLTSIPVPADSRTNLYFVTGESEASAMDIIVGYGGYITVADAAALELGDNFTIEIDDVYINTDNGTDKNLVFKDEAIQVYISANGEITARIVEGTDSQDTSNSTLPLNSTASERAGQLIDVYPASTIWSVDLYLAKFDTPTGTAYCRIWDNAAPPNILGTLGTIDVSTLGAAAYYTFDTTPVTVGAGAIVVGIEYDGGDGANYITTGAFNAQVKAGEELVYSVLGNNWTVPGNRDMRYRNLTRQLSVTATGIASGEHDIVVSADGVDLEISVDGAVAPAPGYDTIALGGASVPDNANTWYLMSNNVTEFMPYMGNYQHTVGGTLIAHYEPNAIILTTVLPDRAGAAQNGVITWGANPAGVGVTLGSMASSGQPDIGVAADTSTSDILPVTGGTDWRPATTVSVQLQANPLRPVVTAVSDNTTLSEYQVWVWFGGIFVVLIFAITASSVHGHHLITGIATSAAIVLMVVWTVFPLWSLVVVVLAVWRGLVSERSPSL